MKTKECSAYQRSTHACRNGFPVVSGACFGIVELGCTSCGKGVTTPPCIKEEPGMHAVEEDGLPINWPLRNPAIDSKAVGND